MSSPDLHSYLQRLFQNSPGDDLIWTKVIDAINRRAVDLESLWTACPLILDNLRTRSCDDRIIALKLVVVYSRHLQATQMMRCDTAISFLAVLPDELVNAVKDKIARFIRAPASFRHIGPWDTNEDENAIPGLSVERSAWVALHTCDWKFLTVLVRYGFWNGRIAPEDDFGEFFDFCKYAQSQSRDLEFQELPSHELLWEAEELWLNLQQNDDRTSINRGRGFQRIPLIVRMLRALTLFQSQRLRDYLQCLRVYFTTVLGPLVSVDEVQEFLPRILKSDCDRHVVERLVRDFRIVFAQELHVPRSLRHQSRWTLRKEMERNTAAPLPKLVADLNIPNTLKDLLLGVPEWSSW